MGRTSHVANVTPEVIRVPLMIHLPQSLRSAMVWSADDVVTLRDITPTLYYLLGHRPLKTDPMIGRPLFTLTAAEQKREPVDHYLLMSSYQAVFGILSADQKKLFMTDAVLHRNSFFDLSADPLAFKNRVTADIVKQYQPVLRQDLENIDKFYNVSEQQLSH
jgi:arylsulfatase A-like enzyme